MDFQQDSRTEEWFLIIGDWFRSTDRKWFLALALFIVLAFPAYLFVSFTFSNILTSGIRPFPISYTEVEKKPLAVLEQKVFSFNDGTYSGYARLKNENSEWGVPEQKYEGVFKSSSGSTVKVIPGTTFILPFTEKVVVFPRFESSNAPAKLEVSLKESAFIRPPNLPSTNLEIQRREISVAGTQTLVNAVIVNRTPFKISRVDLPVLLFNSSNQVVGAGYTNINDLASAESRSFQYTWFSAITGVSRIEILPEINVYNRNIFILGPGQNPFDPELEDD